MTRHLSTAAVLLLASARVWADESAPQTAAAPKISESGCAGDPAAWAPGLGLKAPKDGGDALALCPEKKKPRPGFPAGAPDDGMTGIVPADPDAQAKALQRQAEDYSRTQALRTRVGALKNPWSGAPAEADPLPGVDLLSPHTAMPPQSFQKAKLNASPAMTARFQAAAPAVPDPVAAPPSKTSWSWKGKVCEELPQFVSPKVTWCHPPGAVAQ